jgi:hypothetical protein
MSEQIKGLTYAGKAARNEVTGDFMVTGVPSDAYRDNYDAIFRKPKAEVVDLDDHRPRVLASVKCLWCLHRHISVHPESLHDNPKPLLECPNCHKMTPPPPLMDPDD